MDSTRLQETRDHVGCILWPAISSIVGYNTYVSDLVDNSLDYQLIFLVGGNHVGSSSYTSDRIDALFINNSDVNSSVMLNYSEYSIYNDLPFTAPGWYGPVWLPIDLTDVSYDYDYTMGNNTHYVTTTYESAMLMIGLFCQFILSSCTLNFAHPVFCGTRKFCMCCVFQHKKILCVFFLFVVVFGQVTVPYN